MLLHQADAGLSNKGNKDKTPMVTSSSRPLWKFWRPKVPQVSVSNTPIRESIFILVSQDIEVKLPSVKYQYVLA